MKKICIDFCLFVKGGGNVVYVMIVSIVVIAATQRYDRFLPRFQ